MPSPAALAAVVLLAALVPACKSARVGAAAADADSAPPDIVIEPVERAPAAAAAPAAVKAGADWNDGAIAWRSPEAGLAEAKRTGKPVCLVVFTTWCPKCTAYSGVFSDPRIVEASRKLVMIRVDQDASPEVGERYAPDGQYIPRTLFLAPDGKLEDGIRASDGRYAYFYPPEDPAPLLASLRRAAP